MKRVSSGVCPAWILLLHGFRVLGLNLFSYYSSLLKRFLSSELLNIWWKSSVFGAAGAALCEIGIYRTKTPHLASRLRENIHSRGVSQLLQTTEGLLWQHKNPSDTDLKSSALSPPCMCYLWQWGRLMRKPICRSAVMPGPAPKQNSSLITVWFSVMQRCWNKNKSV